MSPEEDHLFHDSRSVFLYVVLPLILGIIIFLFVPQPADGKIRHPV